LKRLQAVFAVLVFLLPVFRPAPSAAGRPIAGSKHDFVGHIFKHSGENMVSTADCGKCHSTHGGSMLPANRCSMCHMVHRPKRILPLWARSNPTGSGWAVWNGGSGQALDGSQSPEYITAEQFMASPSGMCLSCHDSGTAGSLRDLSSHHPMAKVVPFGAPGWKQDLAAGNMLAGSDVVVETNGTVGCTSCHSMHNSNPADPKLRRTGELCLSCHTR